MYLNTPQVYTPSIQHVQLALTQPVPVPQVPVQPAPVPWVPPQLVQVPPNPVQSVPVPQMPVRPALGQSPVQLVSLLWSPVQSVSFSQPLVQSVPVPQTPAQSITPLVPAQPPPEVAHLISLVQAIVPLTLPPPEDGELPLHSSFPIAWWEFIDLSTSFVLYNMLFSHTFPSGPDGYNHTHRVHKRVCWSRKVCWKWYKNYKFH